MIGTIINKLGEIIEKKIYTYQFDSVYFNKPIEIHEIEKLEKKFHIILPDDFKLFLYMIGNGGFGPGLGIIPFGLDSVIDPRIPVEMNNKINCRANFQYMRTWNYEPLRQAIEENSKDTDKLMDYYYSVERINGTIRIGDHGCGCINLLVVQGEEYGKIWADARGSFGGITPIVTPDNTSHHLSFLEWYDAWLTEIVEQIPLNQRYFS